MIVKEPDDKQDALGELRRMLSEDHGHRVRNRINKEIQDIIDGMRGEADCAYHLNTAFASCPEHMVIHDLVIEHDGANVQIDHVVVTSRRQVFVIENKAIKGTMKVDADGTCTAIYENGGRYPMPSPIEQVRRHASVLRNWLGATGSTMREVVPLVSLPPRTRLKSDIDLQDVQVVGTDLLPKHIMQREEADNSRYVVVRAERAAAEEVAGAAWLISRAHRPRGTDWARQMGVDVKPRQAVQAEMFAAGKEGGSSTLASVAREMKREDAQAVSTTPVLRADVLNGWLETFDRGDGRITLRWGEGADKKRFGDECKARRGRYNDAKRCWTLQADAARDVIDLLMRPAPRQEDMFEPIDITIPGSLDGETTRTNVDTPYGQVAVIHAAGAMARIQGAGMNQVLTAHVRAICTGRAKRDVVLGDWLLPDAMRDDILRDLALPAVRIAS